MRRYFKIVEYGYLLIALFLTEETIRTWGDNSKSFLYIALALMALFMFFFRRWYRKKHERENEDQE